MDLVTFVTVVAACLLLGGLLAIYLIYAPKADRWFADHPAVGPIIVGVLFTLLLAGIYAMNQDVVIDPPGTTLPDRTPPRG
jgi:hypothetical protein